MSRFTIVGPTWRTSYIQDNFPSHHTLFCSTEIPDIKTLENSDFFITCGFDRRIKEDVLSLFNPLNRLNIHATYLPFGKGIGTALFSLLYPTPLGSSIHVLRPKIDTGEVICQAILNPPPSITTQRELYHCWVIHASRLFLDNIDAIAELHLPLLSQSNQFNTPYISRDESELILSLLPKRWDSSLREVNNLSHVLAFRSSYFLLNDID
ncbi:hypothetical protein [Synechococcus sp. A15-24]|uniref:hypothetical protein n=1 Tax=Synechococcus sp. A15-24 TaxID=1050635 RepID=UPI0018608B82|nr:hypothetical protein [Synechococcus sp. A15-24]QNJ27825.1 formyl transferase family protein [Synechococcus sp. A15-24]